MSTSDCPALVKTVRSDVRVSPPPPPRTQDVVFEELWRLLAGTFFAAAAAAFALKVASDRRMLDDAAVQRLQLGFFWFALLAVILHLTHLLFVKSLTAWGLLIGAAAMAPALLVPTVHLGMSGGFGLATAANSFTTALGNVFAPRRLTFAVGLYSLLTVLFMLAGMGYLAFPKQTLKWTFGYHADKRAVFLWQWLGAGMVRPPPLRAAPQPNRPAAEPRSAHAQPASHALSPRPLP